MPAIAFPVEATNAVNALVKRKNWAAREPGVIVVFAIVGAVVILLIVLWIYKKIQAKKALKPLT